jgi:methyl-accepting chemotaxis protein
MKFLFAPAVGLLNRLRYTTKFMLICVIAALVGVLLLSQLYRQGGMEIERARTEQAGVAVLERMMTALSLMQQHRGMTSGLLGGDASLAPKVAEKAKALDAAMSGVEQALAGPGAGFGLDERWAQIKGAWGPLKDGNPQDRKANFAAHSAMVRQNLNLMLAVGDMSHLAFDPNASTANLISILVVDAPEMSEMLGRLRGYGTGLVARGTLSPEDHDKLVAQLAQLEMTKNTIVSHLGRTAEGMPELAGRLATAVKDIEAGFNALSTVANQELMEGRFGIAPADFFKIGTQAITALVGHLDDTVRPAVVAQVSAQEQRARTQLTVLMGSSIVAVLVLFYLMVGMYYSIVGSVQELNAGARQLASGDYTAQVRFSAQDELAEVATQFNDMAARLRGIIVQVKDTSAELGSLSARMAQSASAVAEASETQSQSASGMAAAIEEMTVGIDEISRNAGSAAEESRASGSLASEGAEVVRRSVTEMERIAESVNETAVVIRALGDQSGAISTIVNAISEIADQTNLLALNAAIEAARAGESGRGFAVVADEVRKLAERTAQATRQITDMVGAIQEGTNKAVVTMEHGVQQVRQGVDLTIRAGESMDNINRGAASVVHYVADISHALREQSAASTDIARNVEAIAQMAERNSAAVRDAAGTAAQLERMSNTLSDEVAHFRV